MAVCAFRAPHATRGGALTRGSRIYGGRFVRDEHVVHREGRPDAFGESTNVRSRWQRSVDDAYDVVTEFQVKDRWVPGFSLHMQRERSSPT
jgi:hypothetical protein